MTVASTASAQSPTGSEAAANANFSEIRYAQCWEDADVLLEGLDVRPGDVCLSITSAGDNALGLLTRDPARVVALDLSPAQLACLELRVCAYRNLAHAELLELIGSRPSERRGALYARCRDGLSPAARRFWDARPEQVSAGVGGIGKFERYFAMFRKYVVPLVHGRRRVDRLLQGGSLEVRRAFYDREWDTVRWRMLFRVFFSRFVMGRLGRDPAFFKYVEGSVSERILARSRYALSELDPAENPYLQWILTGRHTTALPLALRPEHFETIRSRLDRIEWHCRSVEDYLDECGAGCIDRYNLSDIFEYMSPDRYHGLLDRIVRSARPGARLAYWNMLAPRHRPDSMADRLRPLIELSRRLHGEDKAFFYSDFVVEEVVGA
jgi:S-adenosylmethionine-diacylglycerol 3-amino-3-carboxypropyl transferase